MISIRSKRIVMYIVFTLTIVHLNSGCSEVHAQFEEQTTIESVESMKAKAYQLNQQAIQLMNQKRYKEAIPIAKQALVLSRKVSGSPSHNLAADLFSLANVYMATGDYFNAEPLIKEAISIDRKLYGEQHPEVAIDIGGLGLLHKNKGDYATAEKYFLDATVMIQNSLAKESNNKYLMYQANLFHNLGSTQVAMKKYKMALISYNNAEQIYEVLHKPNAIELLIEMAEIQRQLGDHAAAEAFLKRARQLSQ